MVSPIDRLARELAVLKGQVKGLSRTPQLAYSSIENGSVDEYDGDGTLVSVIGKQYDGTHGAVVVSGPVPPAPNAPLVTGGLSLNIGWDGTFVNDAGIQDITIPAPMDFTRVELHASQTSGFSADTADTLIDTIESPRGGTRPAMLDEGTWYAVLVARSASGKRSAQSAEASAVVTPPVGADVDVDALREEFAAADEALNKALAENAVVQLALRGAVTELQDTTLPALNAELSLAKGRLDDADHLLNVTFPQRISEAEGTAGTALANANAALTMAGSGSRVLYGTTNPSGTAREGDTWRKTASATGDVIAEWRYAKNSAGALVWTPQQVTSDMVSNLDIGKLSAGTGTFITAVAEKMAAATASIQKADIGNLTVTGSSQLNTLTAQRIASGVGQFLSLSTDQLTAGTASIGTGVADRFFADIFATRKLTANQVFIGAGGNLIPDPGFTDAALNTGRQSFSTGTWTLVPGTATEPAAMRHVMSSANDFFQYWTATPTAATMLKVFPGQVFNLSVDVTTTHSAVTRWNAYLLKADGSVSYTGLTSAPAATGRRKLTQEYTIPPGVVGIAFVVACLTNGGTFTVHGNCSATEKITPSLIVDGFFQGLRVIGASIETNTAASRGVKMTDAGLFAYDSTGKETLRFDGANSILTGATIRTAASGARIQISEAGLHGWGADDTQYLKADSSGLEMTGSISTKGKTTEAAPRDIAVRLTTLTRNISDLNRTVPNPAIIFDTNFNEGGSLQAPGIYSPEGTSLRMQARRLSDLANAASVLELREDSVIVGGPSVKVGETDGFFKTDNIALAAKTITIGKTDILSGNIVDLVGNVKVNGSPLSDSGWKSAAYRNSWMDYGNGFGGLQYRLLNGVLYLRGTIKGGAVNSIVSNLPAGFRPIVPTGSSAMEFPIVARQGTTWYSGAMYAYANGDLKYDAPPGAWSGADRVIINASFPL